MTYLGIDIGTSGVKALLIDEHGRALGEASAASVEPVRPHPGWSEQNPADWWTATLAAVDKLKASHPAELASVRGIGLSGHMHGATLLGKHGDLAGLYTLGAGHTGLVAAREASSRSGAIRVIAHELTDPTRRGLRSGAIDVVLDQNPDGEIREAIAAARSLALGSNGRPATDPIEIGIFLRDNLR